MRILLIEDDHELAATLMRRLRDSGHEPDHRDNGLAGRDAARDGHYDALIVDRLLPGLDGLSVVACLRATGSSTPVLILSALSEVDERIRGLRAGGDDYLVKPFDYDELLARLEAVVRRVGAPAAGATVPTRLKAADLELDLLARTATRGGTAIELKPQEFKLLEYLVRSAGQIVTRAMILETVWDYHFDPQTNVVDVHVSRLRAKIEIDQRPPLIHTIRGIGYCLRETPP